jgi:MFS family permease
MGICLPFSGIAAGFLRRKWIVITGVVLFSFGTFLSSFASGIGLFILSYGIITSSGQAFVGASASSLISQYHVDTRATAFSIYQSALYLGIISFSAVSGYLGGMKDMGSGAWKLPFRVFGLAGLAIAVLLIFVLNDKHPSAASRGPAKKRSFKEAATILFRRPSALLTAFSLLMFIAVDGSYRNWMPNLLGEKFNGVIDPKWIPLNALAWHFAGAFIGVAIGSRFSDKFAKFRPSVRLETMMTGMLAAIPFIILMAFASNFVVCCAAMALFGVFRGVYDSNLFAALFEVIPQRYHAAGAAIAFSVSFLLGSFSSMITGWMKDNLTVQFSIAAFAGFYIVGALMLMIARFFFFKRDYERMNEQ